MITELRRKGMKRTADKLLRDFRKENKLLKKEEKSMIIAEFRQELNALGLCSYGCTLYHMCGNKAVKGHRTCKKHFDYNKERYLNTKDLNTS
jgi:hypothetical protein